MDSPALFEPARLGPLVVRNRIIKAATFEGRTPDGVVTDELIDFHRAVAEGGAGMTTVAYLAVSPGGRTHRHGIWLGDHARDGLRRLTDAVHESGAAVAAQIGHAGPVADARSNGAPALAPSPMFNPLSMRRAHVPDEAELGAVTDRFAAAARLAVDAGFDCLEVHLGHSYLLSAFLSRALNRRRDGFGGSLQNRARLPRQVLGAVREAAGRGVAVTAKLNMVDGFPGGMWLDESLAVARLLEVDGHLDAIELTGGSSLVNPMLLFRGDAPRYEFGKTLPWWLRGAYRLGGYRFLREYPYQEAYFLDLARQFRDAVDLPLVLLGGISRLDTAERALTEGFEFVAMARALLREPDLPNRWRTGERSDSLCIHCNKCMPTIYSGTRCVLPPPRRSTGGQSPAPGGQLPVRVVPDPTEPVVARVNDAT